MSARWSPVRLCTQRVAVTHRPESVRLVAQRCAEILQTIDLAISRLTDLAGNRHEVIPIDSGCTCGKRAGRPLGAIIGVSSDTILRCDVRPGHFQQVELGSDLKQRTVMGCVAMHAPHVAGDVGNPEPATKSVDNRRCLVSQFPQGGVVSVPTTYQRWLILDRSVVPTTSRFFLVSS